jgi:hypothetical protein
MGVFTVATIQMLGDNIQRPEPKSPWMGIRNIGINLINRFCYYFLFNFIPGSLPKKV